MDPKKVAKTQKKCYFSRKNCSKGFFFSESDYHYSPTRRIPLVDSHQLLKNPGFAHGPQAHTFFSQLTRTTSHKYHCQPIPGHTTAYTRKNGCSRFSLPSMYRPSVLFIVAHTNACVLRFCLRKCPEIRECFEHPPTYSGKFPARLPINGHQEVHQLSFAEASWHHSHFFPPPTAPLRLSHSSPRSTP